MKKILKCIFIIAIVYVGAVNIAADTFFPELKPIVEHPTEFVEDIINTPNTPNQSDIPNLPNGEIEITFVDVDQGDCTIIRDGEETMVIDTGKYYAYDNVQSVLDEYNDNIDVLILTHPDADHIQSASDLIEDYGVEEIWMPVVKSDSETYQYLISAIEEYNVKVVYPNAGDEITFGEATYTIIGPVENKPNVYDDTNSYSLILYVEHGNNTFLFSGDATGEEMYDVVTAGYDVSVDIFKVSHHGSANDGCNSEDLLYRVNPKYAIISCGYGNSYGHPHVETMQLLKDNDCNVFRTDLQGTITCISSKDGVSWDKEPTEDFRNGNKIK